MPRIQADSVAAHVAHQEAAVFDAAISLFCERGYAQVSLGDIAAQVGLARNSLYRYFPDKAHILVRWFRNELPVQVERSRQLLTGDDPPTDRVVRWARDQLDYARQPEHQLIAALSDVAPELDTETRAELADSHRQLLLPLSDALAEAGIRGEDDRSAVADLIGGLVLAAAQREQRSGDDPVVRAHLDTAIRGLMAPAHPRAR